MGENKDIYMHRMERIFLIIDFIICSLQTSYTSYQTPFDASCVISRANLDTMKLKLTQQYFSLLENFREWHQLQNSIQVKQF